MTAPAPTPYRRPKPRPKLVARDGELVDRRRLPWSDIPTRIVHLPVPVREYAQLKRDRARGRWVAWAAVLVAVGAVVLAVLR